jgi:hypothetical protein
MKRKVLYASVASMLTAVANAQNPNVTWGTPHGFTGSSDVSTLGTYYGSWAPYDGNASSLPVNGVTFQGSTDLPDFSQSGFDAGYGSFPNPGTPSGNYNSLLEVGAYGYPSYTGQSYATFSWGGMTPGQEYLLEFWVNSNDPNRTETLTGGAYTSAVLNDDPGTYIIGTFVADSTGDETITINGEVGDDYPQINLLQVRAVPEPSTLAIFTGGAGALIFGLRRKCRVG